jgi:hypothetical protein
VVSSWLLPRCTRGFVDPLIVEALVLRDACTLAAEKGYE